MKILAVDDEEVMLMGLLNTIRDAIPDCEIESFLFPDDALEYAKENKIDVAFLDIEMPVMNGIELAKKLKMINQNIDVIFVTAYNEFKGDAMDIHASGYVTKPVTTKSILNELQFLRYKNISEKNQNDLIVKTFGNFDIFYKGKSINFSYNKTKELVAYLVSRRGSSVTKNEICAVLWEDDGDKSSYFRSLIYDLKKILIKNNIKNFLICSFNKYAINTESFKCDWYDYIEGDPIAINSYHNEYMAQYSWAEGLFRKRIYSNKRN